MRNKLISLFFCLVLVAGLAAGLLTPDRYYSESEKRTLTQLPKLTAAQVLSGAFGTNIEKYLTDQFPARDWWITVKTLAERLSGKQDINQVFYGRDGYLIDRFDSYSQKQLNANLAALKALADRLAAQGIELRLMPVPTAVDVLADKLPPHAPHTEQSAIIECARQQGLSVVDVRPALLAHSDEYIYYRTDHHFTSLGAYYCYAAWKAAKGQTADPLSAWTSEALCDNFRGTTYAKVNDPSAACDIITAYYRTLRHTVSYNGGEYVADSIYERKYLSGKDQYAVFLNSNQATTVVNGAGKGKLLILKDSYSNCFAQFTVDEYAETHLIDLRFFRGSVSDYAAENGITEVLVLYEIPNFAGDTYVAAVK